MPSCSSLFSQGRSRFCSRAVAARRGRKPSTAWPGRRAPSAASWSEPRTSKRSRCMTLWKREGRRWARARTCTSAAAASRASRGEGTPPPRCASCTLRRTLLASPSRCLVSFMSASSSRKALYSFSRTSAAVASASWSAAISWPRPSISVFSEASLAAAPSRNASSSAMRCSAASTASVFSFLFLRHQHMYFSQASSSAPASFVTCAFISVSSVITWRIGRISAVTAEVAAGCATASAAPWKAQPRSTDRQTVRSPAIADYSGAGEVVSLC
mmetsp:Transcript_43790/g.124857  ORF Transcript_43790/g.124857 Transcript_43790/m.124857 type:complete len:271 (-) Transcript_43790:20-832(-)